MKSISQKRRDFVLRLGQAMSVAGVSSFAPQVFAKPSGRSANIKSVTLKKGDNGKQRLVFELDKSVRHKFFTLKSPDRIVLDFLNTSSKTNLKLGRNGRSQDKNVLVKNLRQSVRNKNDFRVVLDLAQQARAKVKLRKKASGHFLEVALSPRQNLGTDSPQKQIKKAVNSVGRRSGRKPMIVAIDAGHGGRDPGAVGKKGTKEKHIALQIAKRLQNHINRQIGIFIFRL